MQEVKQLGQLLRIFIYIEEGILCLSILTSLGMILKTKRVFSRIIMQPSAKMSAAPEYDYVWRVRDLSLRSCIGYLSLILSMTNYICSCGYIYLYMAYSGAVADNNLDSIQCEIASAWAMLGYCTLFQATLGTLCCLIFISSCCLKSLHALGFICPLTTTWIKKRLLSLPHRYEHYRDEFDFEC